jgi:hypothetical protein
MNRFSSADSHATKVSTDWAERQQYWRRKLGRLRLGVEPLDEQLARYLGVTWGLTIVPAVIGTIIIVLFTVFGAWRIGVLLAGLLFLPVVAVAWLDYWRIRRNVERYEAERREYEARASVQR